MSARALISARRIREPVGDDPRSRRQGRFDRLVDMIDPCGREKDCFGGRAKRLDDAGQEHFAQDFGARRSARLAGRNGLNSRFPEMAQEMANLGRFASAFAAFERDEDSALSRGMDLCPRLVHRLSDIFAEQVARIFKPGVHRPARQRAISTAAAVFKGRSSICSVPRKS